MNAEELLKYLEKCVNDLDLDFEPIITPTMYDPREMQEDVRIVVMKPYIKDGELIGTVPKFEIAVRDLERIRNLRKLGL